MRKGLIFSFAMLVSSCGGFTGLQHNSSVDAFKASRQSVLGIAFQDVNRGGGLQNRLSKSKRPLEDKLQDLKSGQGTEEDNTVSVEDLKFLDEDIFPSSSGSTYGAKLETDDTLSLEDKSPLVPDITKDLPAEVSIDAVESKGIVTPSVYFFTAMNEDRNSCVESERRDLIDPNGNVLDRVCPKTFAACEMQGSCLVRRNGKNRLYNVHSVKSGKTRFFEMTRTECRYGYGVHSTCLDPFYSVAADLRIYKPGDVLFIPGVVGAELPDGSKHSGYFVVRDKGRAIVGKGRFDFYSGFMSWRDPKNPFVKLGLSDKRTRINYYKMKGEVTDKIRKYRGFPRLPRKT